MLLASPRYPFTEQYVSGAPDDAGIYALIEHRTTLFIGLASHQTGIRTQLFAHLRGLVQPSSATHYGWEVLSNPILRYEQLLRELKAIGQWPRFNT